MTAAGSLYLLFTILVVSPLALAQANFIPPTTQKTSEPIPREQLDAMYQRELAKLYNPADFPRLLLRNN